MKNDKPASIELKPSEPPDQGSDRLRTVADLAKQFSVSQSLVYQLVDAGKLPFIRIGNGRGTIRFDRADIAQYLKSRRINRTPINKPTQR